MATKGIVWVEMDAELPGLSKYPLVPFPKENARCRVVT